MEYKPRHFKEYKPYLVQPLFSIKIRNSAFTEYTIESLTLPSILVKYNSSFIIESDIKLEPNTVGFFYFNEPLTRRKELAYQSLIPKIIKAYHNLSYCPYKSYVNYWNAKKVVKDGYYEK